MFEPIVFISHFKVKAGKAEEYKKLQHEIAEQLEVDKPRTLAFLSYLTDDLTQVTVMHVFGDAESMAVHFRGSDERSKAAYAFLQPHGWEIYGRPSEEVVESMRGAAAASGAALTLQPDYVAGFLRPTSA